AALILLLSQVERARYRQYIEHTCHGQERGSVLVQASVEETTRAEEKPRRQIGSARKQFRERTGVEEECGKAVQARELGWLRPPVSTMERDARGECDPDGECEDRELQVAAHQEVGASGDEASKYGEQQSAHRGAPPSAGCERGTS